MSQPESTRPIKPKSSKIGVVLATLFVLALFGGVVGSVVIGSVSLFDDQEAASETDQAEQTNEADTETTGAGGPIGNLLSRYLSNSMMNQWEQQAAVGSTNAMLMLGHVHRYGHLEDELGFMSPHVEIDLQQAAQWYEQAMNAGNVKGGVALAALHIEGSLANADEAYGWQLMERVAISGKDREALHILYLRHSKDPEAVHYDLFKAIAYAETLSEMGEAKYDFCANYYKLTEGLPDMMRQKGARWMVDASASGDHRAHFTLAGLYGEGVLLDQSYALMSSELENAAARAGDYNAADWLSYNYADEVKQDESATLQAIKWGYIAMLLRGYESTEIRGTSYFDDVDVEITPSVDDKAFEAAKRWFQTNRDEASGATFVTLNRALTYCD